MAEITLVHYAKYALHVHINPTSTSLKFQKKVVLSKGERKKTTYLETQYINNNMVEY